jgi:hypothetical protein
MRRLALDGAVRGGWRDRVAWAVATAALRWIATENYEKLIVGLIAYGRAAVELEMEARLDARTRGAERAGDEPRGGGGDAAAEGDGAAASASGEP